MTPPRDELIELATALSDGDFTPAQAARLRELLTAHGDLLTVYVRVLLLQSLLSQEVEGLRQGMTEAESGAMAAGRLGRRRRPSLA